MFLLKSRHDVGSHDCLHQRSVKWAKYHSFVLAFYPSLHPSFCPPLITFLWLLSHHGNQTKKMKQPFYNKNDVTLICTLEECVHVCEKEFNSLKFQTL